MGQENHQGLHDKNTMKAYKITDLKGYCEYATIVFAESRGKAKAIAITTDSFNDYDYTEISARRVPTLDKYYRGECEMDWYDSGDRIAMVKDAGFSCAPDCWEPEDCDKCPARQWCDRCEGES